MKADGRLSRDLAIEYDIPQSIADYWRDQPMGDTAGHFVADYEVILKRGFAGLKSEIARHESTPFYEAADIACQAAMRFAQRHAQKARELVSHEANPTRKCELQEIARISAKVPAKPAETFREALHAFWLTHVMIHINSKE